jgi:hypothetical protein
VCQNVSVVPASTPKLGLTRTLSAVLPVDVSGAYHEWVGVWLRAVLHAQSVVPLTAWWVHPALSKPPAASNVSVIVDVVPGPVGCPDLSTAFDSSAPLVVSTAWTT